VFPKDNPCFVLSDNLPQFDFGEFPHHPLEFKKTAFLNETQLVHFYLYISKETVPVGNMLQVIMNQERRL
jgi:hypothetical protein